MAVQAEKKNRVWIWVLVCVAVVIALAVIGLYVGPGATLREAQKAQSDGEFDRAAALYTMVDETRVLGVRLSTLPLGAYRGAAEKAEAALVAKESSLLSRADTQLANEDFAGARATYASLSDAATASQRTAAAWYAEAEALLAAEDFNGAHDAFEQAGDYSDAANRAQSVYALHGEKLLSEGRWADAADAFSLAGMTDARDYCKARIALEAGELLQAEPLLVSAGAYADAEEILAEYLPRIKDARELADKREPFLTIGGKVEFGHYEQDDDLANGDEPLSWLVAAVDGDQVMLITEYVIDVLPFTNPAMAVTWADSSLAWWLNQRFVRLAFTAEEQTWLVGRDGAVTAATHTDLADMNDLASPMLVTIPDSIEAMSFFGGSEALRTAGTPYALAQQLAADEDGHARFWMRTDGYYGDSAATMQDEVAFMRVDDRLTGIRPAIWVDLVSMFE